MFPFALMNLGGWQLHRVWSTDWWTNPEGEVDKIEAALARPRKATPEVPPATAVQPADEVVGLAGESKPMAETLDSAPLLVPPQQRDLPAYKPITIDTLLGAAEQFYEPSSDEKIRSVILRVVEQESCALGFSWTLACERVLAGGVSR